MLYVRCALSVPSCVTAQSFFFVPHQSLKFTALPLRSRGSPRRLAQGQLQVLDLPSFLFTQNGQSRPEAEAGGAGRREMKRECARPKGSESSTPHNAAFLRLVEREHRSKRRHKCRQLLLRGHVRYLTGLLGLVKVSLVFDDSTTYKVRLLLARDAVSPLKESSFVAVGLVNPGRFGSFSVGVGAPQICTSVAAKRNMGSEHR